MIVKRLPAALRFVRRRIAVRLVWPVPCGLSNMCLQRALLAAIAAHVSLPSASNARSRATPVVVSSVTPCRFGTRSGRCSRMRRVSSAPSSITSSGPVSATSSRSEVNSSGDTPWRACTSIPRATSAAHTASCVDRALLPAATTSAPASASSVARYAVFASRWTTTATLRPRSAPSFRCFAASRVSTGECRAAHWMRRSPSSARLGSAILERLAAVLVTAKRIVSAPGWLDAQAHERHQIGEIVLTEPLARRRVVVRGRRAGAPVGEVDPVGELLVAVVDPEAHGGRQGAPRGAKRPAGGGTRLERVRVEPRQDPPGTAHAVPLAEVLRDEGVVDADERERLLQGLVRPLEQVAVEEHEQALPSEDLDERRQDAPVLAERDVRVRLVRRAARICERPRLELLVDRLAE